MPAQQPKSQTMGLLIALSILMAVGFVVLYFKMDLDANVLSSQVGMLSQQVAANKIIKTAPVPIQQQSQTTATPADPVVFATTGLDVHVTPKWTDGNPADFANELTLENIKGGVGECGHALKADSYYQSLISSLAKGKAVEYDITANQPSQDPTFKVYALANSMGYKDLDAVKADLDVCGAGGIYPYAVDSKWIVFVSSCGGASNASLPPPMCGTIQQAVTPTIKLVQ